MTSCGAGDWLVVQHKTTAVGHSAHDELAVLVDWLRDELGDRLDGDEVHGVLIADGASLLLERALRERAFGYLSLTSLGYRRWVRSHTRVAVVGDPDGNAIAYPATHAAGLARTDRRLRTRPAGPPEVPVGRSARH